MSVFSLETCCWAGDASPTEYQIKAAYIFNFVKFIEWPQPQLANDAPITVGILGVNVFGDDLEKALRGKNINGHLLQFVVYHSVEDLTNCQVLFVCKSEEGHFSKILGALHGASVLTVSESDHFIEAGGMINFVIQNNKVRFQINNEAASHAGLKINSKLLELSAH